MLTTTGMIDPYLTLVSGLQNPNSSEFWTTVWFPTQCVRYGNTELSEASTEIVQQAFQVRTFKSLTFAAVAVKIPVGTIF